MARPRNSHPTPAELEVLKLLWDRGPLTVREVMEALGKDRAYTSVMSLLNVMYEKGFLLREPKGRAFLYEAKVGRKRTLSTLVQDLLSRGFEGSASMLVTHLLDQARPAEGELEEIRKAIDSYLQRE